LHDDDLGAGSAAIKNQRWFIRCPTFGRPVDQFLPLVAFLLAAKSGNLDRFARCQIDRFLSKIFSVQPSG